MMSPSDEKRIVAMEDSFTKTGEIAARMEVTTRTVYNLRQRAFKAIKTFYEQGSSDP